MIRGALHPFALKILLVVPETGVQGDIEAIIDTGCTSPHTVEQLGIRTWPLPHPISFEQVNRMLIGRAIVGCGLAKELRCYIYIYKKHHSH